jgi:hypothetical protein
LHQLFNYICCKIANMKGKSYALLEEVLTTVERVGVDNTIKALQFAKKTMNDNSKELQQFIIEVCASKFGFNSKCLRDKSYTFTNKTNAISVLCFLLFKNCNIAQNNVAYLVGLDNTNVSKKIKYISQLNEKNDNDAVLLNVINSIQESINHFKNNKDE